MVARLSRMDEWMGALLGLLGAGVGAGAALWGARATTRASLEMFAVQLQRDDERWVREQRQAAYLAMIRSDMESTDVALKLEGKAGEDGRLPPDLEPLRQASGRESYAALSLIELCGPQPVLEAARELHKWGGTLISARAAVLTGWAFQPGVAFELQQEALQAFRRAAREALGYGADPLMLEPPDQSDEDGPSVG